MSNKVHKRQHHYSTRKCKLNYYELSLPIPTRIAKIKELTISSTGKNAEAWECSYTAGKKRNGTSCFRKQFPNFSKSLNIHPSYNPLPSLLGIYPHKNESLCPHSDLYTNVHGSFICDGPNYKQLKCAGHEYNVCTDAYNRVLLSNKNKNKAGRSNPSTLGGRGGQITRSRNRDHPGQHSEITSLLKYKN